MELAAEFERAGEEADPLGSARLSSSALAILNAKMRTIWANPAALKHTNRKSVVPRPRWIDLSAWEQSSIRKTLAELGARYRDRVRAGSPQKIDQDTLVMELADIFAEFAKLNCRWDRIPKKLIPRVIKFIRTALAPFASSTLVSLGALKTRYLNLKMYERRSWPPFKPGPKRIRRRPDPSKARYVSAKRGQAEKT